MDIVAMVSLGLSGVQGLASLHQSFRKSKVEELCKMILESDVDLSMISSDFKSQGYFFSILDRFVREANMKKIEYWKNAMIHLVTDFRTYDFNDNLLATLEYLTGLDLTVLSQIYAIHSNSGEIISPKLQKLCVEKGIPEELVTQSIKRLASQALINENWVHGRNEFEDFGIGKVEPLVYITNKFGRNFLLFISDYKTE